jgi:hypothetical protein
VEWSRFAIKVPDDEVSAHATALEQQDYSIHFHTFTLTSFLAMMLRAREAYGLPFEVVATETNNHEFIVIARRIAGEAERVSVKDGGYASAGIDTPALRAGVNLVRG